MSERDTRFEASYARLLERDTLVAASNARLNEASFQKVVAEIALRATDTPAAPATTSAAAAPAADDGLPTDVDVESLSAEERDALLKSLKNPFELDLSNLEIPDQTLAALRECGEVLQARDADIREWLRQERAVNAVRIRIVKADLADDVETEKRDAASAALSTPGPANATAAQRETAMSLWVNGPGSREPDVDSSRAAAATAKNVPGVVDADYGRRLVIAQAVEQSKRKNAALLAEYEAHDARACESAQEDLVQNTRKIRLIARETLAAAEAEFELVNREHQLAVHAALMRQLGAHDNEPEEAAAGPSQRTRNVPVHDARRAVETDEDEGLESDNTLA